MLSIGHYDVSIKTLPSLFLTLFLTVGATLAQSAKYLQILIPFLQSLILFLQILILFPTQMLHSAVQPTKCITKESFTVHHYFGAVMVIFFKF